MPRRIRVDRTQGRPEPIRALNRVRERENGERLVSVEGIPRIRIGKASTIAWVREQVAEMLARAARLLPEDIWLHVTEAWRPLERQKMIYDFFWESSLSVFPEMTYAARRRLVNRWVAPVDQKAPPGHCTGAAVDVHLFDEEGQPLDVTSPYSRFEAAATYTLGLEPLAETNRRLLVETMLEAGFSNCREEYWHYSFGDAGWAVREGHSECFYGLAELPEELFTKQQEVWLEELRQRENPFAHRVE